MNVCVVGAGHVGLVAGACLAEIGHRVVCVDDDSAKVGVLQSGGMPIYEPHLEELIQRNRAEGRLTFTHRIEEGLEKALAVFICVGTPPLENGEADLSAVEKVARQVAQVAESYKLIVEKSTVPVQTGRWIERTLKLYNSTGLEFDVASNPEFLREGSAVEDFLHPDRVVIGVQNQRAEKLLRELYTPIVQGTFSCPLHHPCLRVRPVPLLITDIESAELIKHASNSFLAMKISFINAVADICERVGADVKRVAEGMGLDQRIGPSFLNAGIGFGGFCFPKDLQAFVKIAEKLGYDFALLREVERINLNRAGLVLQKLRDRLWILKGKRIGVLGLSFKPNTDDIREAPAIRIIRLLQQEGAGVQAYDPKAMGNAEAELRGVLFCRDAYGVAEGAEAIVVATEWPEFKELDFTRIKATMRRPLLIDGRNLYDKASMLTLGFEYVGIGG